MRPQAIVAENLTRKYGELTAVDGVSFDIREHDIVGLLGHNGAGKTTIMKMVTGYLEPTGGRVLVDGLDIESDRGAAQARMGYLPENCPLYPEMTVVDYLDYAAELRGVVVEKRPAAIRRAIEATELFEKAPQPIGILSRGFQQRVGVAQAILHDPKILILDEPTNGLDPSQIRHMRDLIRRLAETATVILSTHILQEVQAVCDRVIIIHRGQVALDSPLADLRTGGRLRLVTDGPPDETEAVLGAIEPIEGVECIDDRGPGRAYALGLNGHDPNEVAPVVARAVHEKGYRLFALHPEQRDIETIFAQIAAGGTANAEVAHV
ncbi:MAG: ABC transporter ATP-binding protein [Kiloniellaceae bacterium]